MKKIRVLNMVYWLGSGGIERFSVELYRYINHNRIQMDFITKCNIKEFYDEDVKELGAKKITLSISNTTKGFFTKITMLRRAIKLFKRGYNVAYFNISSPADALKYPLLSRCMGMKKTIVHAHSSSDSKSGIIHLIANILGRKYLNNEKIIKFACSETAAKWMFGEKVCDSKKYYEIKNGIDISKFKFNETTRDNYRKKLNIPLDAIVVGQVGRFVELKNHQFTISIAEELVKSNQNIYFVFVGDGQLKSKCEERVKQSSLQNRVMFLGNRKDVGDILQTIDFFVMPSFYEGLPVSAIEAQASGCKCILSDSVTNETDVTGNCVFLPLDKNKWINEIESLAPVNRNQAFEKVVSAGYDINSTARKIEQILAD